MNWTTKQLSRNVFEVRQPLVPNSQWEFWTLLIADKHWDNLECDRKLLKSHLEQAKGRGAAVISAGDALCVMLCGTNRQ